MSVVALFGDTLYCTSDLPLAGLSRADDRMLHSSLEVPRGCQGYDFAEAARGQHAGKHASGAILASQRRDEKGLHCYSWLLEIVGFASVL